jgi:hypothetical protein
MSRSGGGNASRGNAPSMKLRENPSARAAVCEAMAALSKTRSGLSCTLEIPLPFAIARELQCAASLGRLSKVVAITASMRASVYNTFNICRHLIAPATKRRFRTEAFEAWRVAVGIAA